MAVDFAADRMKVFDGAVAAAAAVGCVVAVAYAAEHCDVLAGVFVVAAVEVVLVVVGDAYELGQGHSNSSQ